MRQITEVLRLAAQGLTYRQIGQSVGISASTVQGYLDRARRAGVRWPLPEDMDGAGLEARLFKRSDEDTRSGRPEPNWLAVHRERKQGKHVTLQLPHLEYKAVHPDGWGYTQFCAHYHRWLGRQHVVMRLEYAAGERMFVDFCGDTMPITDPDTGEIAQAQVFVSVLGASGYLYGEATAGQDLVSWLNAHANALEFYRGSPRVVVPDNLKAGVTKACWYDPELNPSYLELARHYAMAVLPTRPYHPRDKAAVEAAVQVAERWVLAPLRKWQFFSLGELNAAITEQVAFVNDRPFRGQKTSRRQLFEELERAALQPLPPTRYELATWKPAKVNIDCHVECAEHYYSVPYQLAREAVDVRATARVVEIFHRGRRVASHLRAYGRRRFITNPDHMPAAHRAHLEWTPSRLVVWGRSVGPAVAELIETILSTRPHPEHGYRACLGLMRLVKHYGRERVQAACERALATGGVSYRSVDTILKNGLDRVPVGGEGPVPGAPIQHANLRGPAYYQQTLEEA
ncbi:MAG: IS21 family transposase [Chloroflexi bacterium]|nr:IS21 family transposase [Chloroflexota bacterium]